MIPKQRPGKAAILYMRIIRISQKGHITNVVVVARCSGALLDNRFSEHRRWVS